MPFLVKEHLCLWPPFGIPVVVLSINKVCIISLTVNNELYATGEFEKLTQASDETEHSIELHLPYIAKIMER